MKMKRRTVLSIITALSLLAAAVAAPDALAAEKTKSATPEKAAKQEAVKKNAKAKEPAKSALKAAFDNSHAEVFPPTGKADLSFSEFHSMFSKAGVQPSVNDARINAGTLKGIKVYVLAGPSMGLSPHEVDALAGFVNGGGSLLVLAHISEPIARLTESFGVVISNFVVAEASGTIDGAPQDFHVTRLADHPVTKGVKDVTLRGSWALLAEGDAKSVGATSPEAWTDVNRNRKKDEGESSESFTVIAAVERGKGRVVIVADDAPFTDKFIKDADNARLAANIIHWLKGE